MSKGKSEKFGNKNLKSEIKNPTSKIAKSVMTNQNKGTRMLRRLLGENRAREIRATWSKLSPDFAHFVTDFLAGEIWSRPHLDLKTRSLITVAALTALGRPSGLRLNIEMAVNNGAAKEEILETLLQMAPYAGFPACWEGLVIADEVFKQKEAASRK